MKKYKLIALFGEAGAGKDTILNKIAAGPHKEKLHSVISCTTRPPREGEQNGVNYHFISLQEFTDKVLQDEMLEASCFNNWMYGTPITSLNENKINIGVFNLEGIENLMQDGRVDIQAYYVEVPAKERIIRQLNRETVPDICEIFRRFKTDCDDFAEINFYYNILNNLTEEDMNESLKILNEDIANMIKGLT